MRHNPLCYPTNPILRSPFHSRTYLNRPPPPSTASFARARGVGVPRPPRPYRFSRRLLVSCRDQRPSLRRTPRKITNRSHVASQQMAVILVSSRLLASSHGQPVKKNNNYCFHRHCQAAAVLKSQQERRSWPESAGEHRDRGTDYVGDLRPTNGTATSAKACWGLGAPRCG